MTGCDKQHLHGSTSAINVVLKVGWFTSVDKYSYNNTQHIAKSYIASKEKSLISCISYRGGIS